MTEISSGDGLEVVGYSVVTLVEVTKMSQDAALCELVEVSSRKVLK